jgi:hypothetical protein
MVCFNQQHTVHVQFNEETGEYFVELQKEICESLDWQVGTVIQWIDNGDGSFTLVKKNV